MKRHLRILALILSLGGCVTAPIMNVEHAPIRMNKPDYTLEDVERGIVRAGIGLGWEMFKVRPGTIEGTLQIRNHLVKVTVAYTLTEYNILYQDSKNMVIIQTP